MKQNEKYFSFHCNIFRGKGVYIHELTCKKYKTVSCNPDPCCSIINMSMLQQGLSVAPLNPQLFIAFINPAEELNSFKKIGF